MAERPLGRLAPTDQRHVERYPLTAATLPSKPTPVVLGIEWQTGFDRPQKRGDAYYVTLTGHVRGGHAICLKPPALTDLQSWWKFYDQEKEGACVGFAVCRMMTLLNRERYDGFWHYHQAQQIDEWPGEAYSGTSVRAGCDVARDVGMRNIRRGKPGRVELGDGISVNRWALSVEDIAACLSPIDNGASVLNAGYVSFLNSWGQEDYPHHVRMSLDALRILVFERGGDATVVTDR